jgi:hypothetical protein
MNDVLREDKLIECEEDVLNTLVWWVVFRDLDASHNEWVGLVQSTPTVSWERASSRHGRRHLAAVPRVDLMRAVVYSEQLLDSMKLTKDKWAHEVD